MEFSQDPVFFQRCRVERAPSVVAELARRGTPTDLLQPQPERRDGQTFVSVVFSFWNEDQVLSELLRRTRAVLRPLVGQGLIGGYELIFVNDASTDRSEEILRRAADDGGDVRLVNMSRNFGVAPCVLAGMQLARGDAVIYMDADLQDPPEVIPELIRTWQADPDVHVVHTVRRARHGETWLKRAITSLG